MENYILNSTPDAPPSESQAADNQLKRTKTMTEAALAANRANAQKSTGPRTAAGKLKSASNALQHGLYSLTRFEHFIENDDFALEVSSNILEQFGPITPAEHLLAQQLIHLQLRFLQMESLYNRSMQPGPAATLENPPAMLPLLLRELNNLPNRIHRAIKALHAEIARRPQQIEIEPIPDHEPLPEPPPPPVETKPTDIRYQLFDLFTKRLMERHPSLLAELKTNPALQNEPTPPITEDPAEPLR